METVAARILALAEGKPADNVLAFGTSLHRGRRRRAYVRPLAAAGQPAGPNFALARKPK
jgi:hypothetical protein